MSSSGASITCDSPRRIALLGVPIEIGAGQRGTLMGPAALRTAGIGRVLAELGYAVEDHGDLAPAPVETSVLLPPNAKSYDEIRPWIGKVSEQAYRLARTGALPVFMGGDHSLSMGSVNGVARHCAESGRKLFVLWLDAHADYNTTATTLTGNMHGMSAAFLCGEPGLERLLGDQPREALGPGRLDLFGIRSIDPLEKDLVRERRIAIADMRAIDEFGVGVLIRRVIDRVKAQDGVLHVSFDVDFLDPEIAPGVGTTVPGGATYREAHLVMELLHDSGLVRSLDIVELNPFLDERGRTARVAVELIGSLFGMQISDRPTPSNAVLPDAD
ncbi:MULTISPECIES: arginase [Rhodopseudomonas]|uniref:Arginase n=1 Tax=Rhodopseudomonas palustris TaxID=1076 RepID=A0A0D7EWC5_RHOPL|nr:MULTISPECIES: arginase [Rhodopseudomonas]KIZ43722.1 arginase [Rhodopseudomonas palustris]MDF3812300.1 arginase [Rhodopseudomonas sp. BAL398]WOK16043.1 arginase [Rhodopseudomonas sp. BAL398]